MLKADGAVAYARHGQKRLRLGMSAVRLGTTKTTISITIKIMNPIYGNIDISLGYLLGTSSIIPDKTRGCYSNQPKKNWGDTKGR
tara:strand:- start:22255 stop:22509 length:255 start_codon:yes stop_codon:yes gene_type:complete